MNSTELIGVYNADGGIVGELSYILGKTFQGKHCELCDITHSPFRRKKSWDEFVNGLAYPFELFHLNELSDELRSFVGDQAPLVILRREAELSVLLTGTEMATCNGDVPQFAQLMSSRLAALSL
jgi:hypothetical protein